MRKTTNVILLILAVFLLGFVVAMIWLYVKTGAIPDTLCTCVFAICGGECGVMGWIKTTKERTRERKYELEDREILSDGMGSAGSVGGIDCPDWAEMADEGKQTEGEEENGILG